MYFHRKPPGYVRSEFHQTNGAGLDLSFNVIAVQMQDDWPIRTPPQSDDIALLDPDHLCALRYPPTLDAEVEYELCGAGSDDRHPGRPDERRADETCVKHCAERHRSNSSSRWGSLDLRDPIRRPGLVVGRR